MIYKPKAVFVGQFGPEMFVPSLSGNIKVEQSVVCDPKIDVQSMREAGDMIARSVARSLAKRRVA